jgi:hypothetical protein
MEGSEKPHPKVPPNTLIFSAPNITKSNQRMAEVEEHGFPKTFSSRCLDCHSGLAIPGFAARRRVNKSKAASLRRRPLRLMGGVSHRFQEGA